MENPLIKLREMQGTLGNSEKTVADYLIKNPEEVMKCNIRELADKIYVSPSTVIRLCKHLGFEGYRDFRQAFVYEMALYQKDMKYSNIEKKEDLHSMIEKVTYKNIRSLEETLSLIDVTALKKSVELINSAKNLLFFGIGASFNVAQDAYLKFIRVNKPCCVHEDCHVQYIMARNSTPEDLGIVISYSGETVEMVECLKSLKENNTPTIAITRFTPSTIASMADYVLYTSASETLFRNGASSSRISQLNVIDMIYTAYTADNYEQCVSRIQKTHINKPNEEEAV